MSDDCLFCRIASGEIPATIVYQDATRVAFRDIAPKAPTHLVLIPRKHIPTLNDLQPEDAQTVGELFLLAKELAAKEGIDQSGYRTLFNCNADAGQTVWHLHLHLLGGRGMAWPPG